MHGSPAICHLSARHRCNRVDLHDSRKIVDGDFVTGGFTRTASMLRNQALLQESPGPRLESGYS
jgi:hypothetical protein